MDVKIYQDKEDRDIFWRSDEFDMIREIYDRVGFKIVPYGPNNTYSDKQWEYIFGIQDWILDDFWDVYYPDDFEELYNELLEDEHDSIIEDLGLYRDSNGEVVLAKIKKKSEGKK